MVWSPAAHKSQLTSLLHSEAPTQNSTFWDHRNVAEAVTLKGRVVRFFSVKNDTEGDLFLLILDHPRMSVVGLFLTFSHRGSVSNASVLIKVALKTGNASSFPVSLLKSSLCCYNYRHQSTECQMVYSQWMSHNCGVILSEHCRINCTMIIMPVRTGTKLSKWIWSIGTSPILPIDRLGVLE